MTPFQKNPDACRMTDTLAAGLGVPVKDIIEKEA